MGLVTLIVFAALLGGVLVLMSRGMKLVVCGGGILLMLVGTLLPVRMGDGSMASFAYVIAKPADGKGDAKLSLIFDAVGDGKMSLLPVFALLVAIATALLLLYGFMASMRRRDPDETPGPMIATVMAGLCAALLVPLSIMAYRELRAIHGTLDNPLGWVCFLVFLLGVLMCFFGSIMTARSLPSVPARMWPHREF